MCLDADECVLGTHNCDAAATCTNTVGSFKCACQTGYKGSGVSCYLKVCPAGYDGATLDTCTGKLPKNHKLHLK